MSQLGMPGRAVYGARGFTLIELMVTIAVLAITLTIAAPSFQGLINSNRLVSQSNELVASLQLARSEAIRRNAKVEVCASSDGSTCDTTSDTWTQWLVMIASSGEVLRVNEVNPKVSVMPSAAILNNENHVEFSADGLARDTTNALLVASIGICMETDRPAENTKRLTIAAGGRLATVSEDTDASCEAPDDE